MNAAAPRLRTFTTHNRTGTCDVFGATFVYFGGRGGVVSGCKSRHRELQPGAVQDNCFRTFPFQMQPVKAHLKNIMHTLAPLTAPRREHCDDAQATLVLETCQCFSLHFYIRYPPFSSFLSFVRSITPRELISHSELQMSHRNNV